MNIPRLDHPERYTGLFIYDFGDHVSVGYTAEEVDVLTRSKLHKSGSAYQIYRVTDGGAMELRGIDSLRIGAQEAMLFHFHNQADATAALDDLVRLAQGDPLPTPVHAERATAESMTPPHVMALIYSIYSSDAVGGWLQRVGFDAGQEVSVGSDRLQDYRQAGTTPDESVELSTRLDHRSRSPAEILAAVHRPVQR